MVAETIEVRLARLDDAGVHEGSDALAVEEPLEIRVELERDGRRERRTVAITMRTPGHDAELAAGFLFTEGIVREPAAIAEIRRCAAPNAIRVELAAGDVADLSRLERNFYTTSSCGVCGKSSIAALSAALPFPRAAAEPLVTDALVRQLPEALRAAQAAFARTGGLHASALFDTAGQLLLVREDVGRHNALDKVIGAELLAGRLPARDRVLVVSGRASFELVQKAAMAGIPMLVAVGAPSSLAVSLAEERGMTLVGWTRADRCSVYTGMERLVVDAAAETLA